MWDIDFWTAPFRPAARRAAGVVGRENKEPASKTAIREVTRMRLG